LIDSKDVLLNPEIFRPGTQVKVTGTSAHFWDVTLDGETIVFRQKINGSLDPGSSIRVKGKILLMESRKN
jgi:hypothetical protein